MRGPALLPQIRRWFGQATVHRVPWTVEVARETGARVVHRSDVLAAVCGSVEGGWPSLKSHQRATIGHVGTVLIYLVVVVVVAAVVFLVASLVFGRGEELAALPPDATPTWLPDGPIIGDDVRAVRFAQVLRGYRMSEVDWTLQRAAAELDVLRARVAELEARQ